MSKLSKEQIKALTDKPTEYVTIRLMCDGYRISLQDRLHGRQMRTQLFVNGKFLGKWFIEHESCPEIKFYRQRFFYIKKSPYSKKKKAIEMIRHADFASVGQALRHLNTVCDSVEVIEENDCE